MVVKANGCGGGGEESGERRSRRRSFFPPTSVLPSSSLPTFSALSLSFSDSCSTNSLTSSAPTCSLIISASVSWTTSSPSEGEEGGEAKARWLCRRRRLLKNASSQRESRSARRKEARLLPSLLRDQEGSSDTARGSGSSSGAIVIHAREWLSFFVTRTLSL